MATYGILDQTYLTDIADAIRSKNGSSATYMPGEMPAAIEAITTSDSSGGTDTDTTTTTTASATMTYDGVNFLDHDGTCLYSYSWDEVAEMTSLPDLPTWTAGTEYGFEIPMTCTGWNWSLENIQSYSGTFVNVGAVYEPTDGKTHLIVNLGVNDNVCLYLGGSVADNAVLIDWGDDSTEYTTSTIDTTYSHDYDNAEEGYYEITIEAAEGTARFGGSSYYGAMYQYLSTSSTSYRSSDDTYRRSQLVALYLGTSITNVENYAFYLCYKLTSVTISGSLTTLAAGAFRECPNLTTIIFPDSLVNIDTYTFYNCYGLANILLSDNFTSIGSYAFYYCYSLTDIAFPDALTSIDAYAFYGCYGLINVSFSGSLTSVGANLFNGCTALISINLPEGLTSIGSYEFRNCYSLTSITLPDSLTTIETYAFQNCYGLTSVVLPDSLTSIGTYAFQYCMSLYSIDELYISTAATNTFLYDRRLTELTNVRYVGANVSFANSPLSYQSVINLFNALDSENTGTLTLSSDSYALLSDDDLAIATDKGWTVSA